MRHVTRILLVFLLMFSLMAVASAAEFAYKEGDSGEEIKAIQTQLKALKYYNGKIDGHFRTTMLKSVSDYQKDKKLKITGVVDAKTYRLLMGKEIPQPSKMVQGKDIVKTAEKYKGVPYKFGGDTPKSFDCSGFVQYVYKQHGKVLPRTADKQFAVGKKVTQKDLQPGDLVFFETYEKGASHCGIYAGDGKFIHASSSQGVTTTPLSNTYWKVRYLGARRII